MARRNRTLPLSMLPVHNNLPSLNRATTNSSSSNSSVGSSNYNSGSMATSYRDMFHYLPRQATGSTSSSTSSSLHQRGLHTYSTATTFGQRSSPYFASSHTNHTESPSASYGSSCHRLSVSTSLPNKVSVCRNGLSDLATSVSELSINGTSYKRLDTHTTNAAGESPASVTRIYEASTPTSPASPATLTRSTTITAQPPPPLDSSSTSSSSSSSSSSNNSGAPRALGSATSAGSKNVMVSGQKNLQQGGLVGLNNLGNTCFMNSILQCLSNSAPLLEYCLHEQYRADLNKSSTLRGNLFISYAELMKELWDPLMSFSSTSPHQFKSQIQRFAPRFMGYAQQDAQEFLRYLLEGLHIDVNRVQKRPPSIVPNYEAEDRMPDRDKAELYWKRYISVDNSAIVDLFVGQLMSTLECMDCGFKSTTFDPFWDLSLPIPKKQNVTLLDCLNLFTSKEELDGNERPVCGKCKVRRRCTKYFSIQKFPRILVLHLKRFSGERFRSKMSLLVDYPVNELNLIEFTSKSCSQQSARYRLYAVSNHSGSVYAGHYTACCRHPHLGKWHEYNDTRVRPISERLVVSPEGYVLFYELLDPSG